MAHRTMRLLRKELEPILDAAYLAYDRAVLYNDGLPEATARVETLKEVAELAGVAHIERHRCGLGSCPVWLERWSIGKYCSNACRQKAYRIGKGQMRK